MQKPGSTFEDIYSMIDFLTTLRGRRSIRRFQEKPVPREIVDCLIAAASYAPSASNRQDWRFTVVMNQELKRKMADAVAFRWRELAESATTAVAEGVLSYSANLTWFAEAPVVITVSCRTPDAFLEEMLGPKAEPVAGNRISAAMAAQNLMLAANAEGLGSCCLTGAVAAEDDLITILELGPRRQLVCLIALGYADATPEMPPRKPVEKITRYFD